jgi:hypothetical protein
VIVLRWLQGLVIRALGGRPIDDVAVETAKVDACVVAGLYGPPDSRRIGEKVRAAHAQQVASLTVGDLTAEPSEAGAA